jgi:integrase
MPQGLVESLTLDGHIQELIYRPNPACLSPTMRPTRGGTPIRRPDFGRVCVAAVARSGLPPGLRLHDLRHSYATWLVSDGVPINVVSRLMGHEQISTTLDRYTDDARDYADLRVPRPSPASPLTIC